MAGTISVGMGKPLNADLLKGVGGNQPAYLRDEDGTPMRMFVCANPG